MTTSMPVRVEVGAVLRELADPNLPSHARARSAVSSAVSRVARALGILCAPDVEIVARQQEPAGDLPFELVVNHVRCRYSRELAGNAVAYVLGWPRRRDALASLTSVPADSLPSVLSLITTEVLRRSPAVFLDTTQLARIAADVPQPPAADVLQRILIPVLEQGISIANRSTLTEVITSGLADNAAPEDIAERVIAALAPRRLTIMMPEEYLRELTTVSAADGRNGFTLLRDGLFFELGMVYPPFTFETDATLAPRSFALRINHLTTMPQVGLAAGQVLINSAPSALRPAVASAIPAMNPVYGHEIAIIDATHPTATARKDLTTWDPVGFLVLTVAAQIRENSAQLFDLDRARTALAGLENFPALIHAARTKFSDEHITRTLRGLLVEQLSIRNLRSILEAMVDVDYVVADSARLIVFDDRLPMPATPDANWTKAGTHLVDFVRTTQKSFISNLYTRGQSTLSVYLLDPEIERLFGAGPLSTDDEERIVRAVHDEVSSNTGDVPAVLTVVEVRSALRRLTRDVFPRLAVLAYQELSPDMNIMPVARITL